MRGQQPFLKALKSQEGWQLRTFTSKGTDAKVAASHWELPLV